MGTIEHTALTRHGHFFVLENDSYISRSLLTYGEWTEDETELLAQVLRPGDTVIDAGANIGALTVPFARAVGPAGSVCAFEPQPGIFRLLAANTVINGLANVRLFHAACGAAAGALTLDEHDFAAPANYGALSLEHLSSGTATLRRSVPVLTLDAAFQGDALRLIKIDVEGAETSVLRGAAALIARFRPALYVENEFPERSPELLAAVQSLGYDAYWHLARLFRPDNFRGEAENIFGDIVCVNMICFPAEHDVPVVGLAKVSGLTGHPRKSG